jgi:hypothetical protein
MTAVVAGVEPASVKDLWLSIHEGAHALAAIRFGHEIGAVTIDDVDGGGCVYHQYPASDVRAPTVLEMASLHLWPMEARRLFERSHALAAVARIAEETYAPRRGGYRPPRRTRPSANASCRSSRPQASSGLSTAASRSRRSSAKATR